jgi:hypothetical protein
MRLHVAGGNHKKKVTSRNRHPAVQTIAGTRPRSMRSPRSVHASTDTAMRIPT